MSPKSVVHTTPFLLSVGDRLKTYNASQVVWADILSVYLSSDRQWTYLRVDSNYLPDPYVVRLKSASKVKARKLTPWRRDVPPPPGPEVIKSFVRIRTNRESRYRTAHEGHGPVLIGSARRDPWVKPPERPRPRFSYDDIGFIPDASMEEERRAKRRKKRKKRKTTIAPSGTSLLSHYKTLGCKAGNRVSTIKRRFKKLAFKHHPDRNRGSKASEDQFKKINEAFSALMRALSK